MKSKLWQVAAWLIAPVWVAACTFTAVPLANSPTSALPVSTIAATTADSRPRLPGADVAQVVNRRYTQTPSHCFVSSPAVECSGLLLRTAPAGASGGEFWRIGADEITAGYARLSYARQDLPAVNPPDSVGFILADRPTAAGNGQPYDLVCARAPLGQALPPCADAVDAVGVSLWSVGSPATLAVQAIYYDLAHGGQLAQALRYQKQYYDATGQWVPILRATLGAGAATAFGFDERDQLDWGFKVAQRLEARYLDTRMTCPGNTPGYYCAGVLIRITRHGTEFHSWNPSPDSVGRNGVSFSYARVDMNMATTHSGGAGIVMRELQAPTGHPLTWRCSFPVNAGTNARPGSCGIGTDARLCDARGITTAAQWQAAYGSAPQAGCGLAPTIAQFTVLKELRQTYGAHNEVVLAAWPQNIPEQLPIEAWFYPTAEAKPGGEYIQQDYMAWTGRFMPLLWIDLTKPSGSIFTYRVEDQIGAMNPGALLAPPSDGGPLPGW